MKYPIEFAQKLSIAYTNVCKPLCHTLNIPQTAFDILMFFANNPSYQTARDVVEIRKIKANLVSVNVERLVKEGYLVREELSNDRRKTRLICTQKAQPIIEQGRALQQTFFENLFENVSPEQRENFFKTVDQMSANLDDVLEKKEK